MERSATDKTRWTLPNGEVVEFPRGLRQETALRLIEPGERLLDVGCGRGAVAAALSEHFDEVHGVDADEEALDAAAARGVRTQRVDLDADRLPFPDARFDAVVCLEVIEHVIDPRHLARELARVLRTGGTLYLSTPNIRFVGYLRDLVLRGRFPRTSEDPAGFQGGHVHFFTFADVEDLLHESGFSGVKRHGLATGRYCALARLSASLFSVGIFVVATRGEGPPAELADRRERRSW